MQIHWIPLTIALVLLLPPPVLSETLRRTVMSPRRNSEIKPRDLIRPWQNWVDAIRAGLGTSILVQWAVLAPATSRTGSGYLAVQAALLLVAVGIQSLRLDLQTSRSEQRLQVVAPVFYLSALTLALSDPFSSTFAVAVAWMFTAGAKSPGFALPVMALALGACGYVFGLSMQIMLNVVLILLPFSAAFMFRKRLAFVGITGFGPAPAIKAG